MDDYITSNNCIKKVVLELASLFSNFSNSVAQSLRHCWPKSYIIKYIIQFEYVIMC
jgi:hypothetical protein